MSEQYADSTIALTIYNLLCLTYGALGADALYVQAKSAQHPELERVQFDSALNGLVTRGWVLTTTPATYVCRDPKRRLIVDRDRSQVEVNKGDEGGWSKWRARDPHAAPCNRNATVSIETVMSEAP